MEQQADRLYGTLTGGGAERDALRYFQHVELNTPYIDCMKAKGQTLDLDFVPIWAGYEPNATSMRWLGGLHRRPSDRALGSAEAERLESRPQPVLSDDFKAAMSACEDQQPNAQALPAGQDAGLPPHAAELAAELTQIIHDVDEELGPIAPYNECMSTAGIEFGAFAEDTEGSEALFMYLTGIMPEPPLPGEAPTAEWTAYLDTEGKVLDADDLCRRGQRDAGLAQLAQPLADFEARHTQELGEITQDWSDILTRAEAAGYKP